MHINDIMEGFHQLWENSFLATSDEECAGLGWIQAMLYYPHKNLHISHAPHADVLDGFRAWCHDTQRMIFVIPSQCEYSRVLPAMC